MTPLCSEVVKQNIPSIVISTGSNAPLNIRTPTGSLLNDISSKQLQQGRSINTGTPLIRQRVSHEGRVDRAIIKSHKIHRIFMVNVPKLGQNKIESTDSLTNKVIHWIQHVRGCRSVIRDDIEKACRLTSPTNPLDCIELTFQSEELVENLLALEYRTCSPDHSSIQFRQSLPPSKSNNYHEQLVTRTRIGSSTLECND